MSFLFVFFCSRISIRVVFVFMVIRSNAQPLEMEMVQKMRGWIYVHSMSTNMSLNVSDFIIQYSANNLKS